MSTSRGIITVSIMIAIFITLEEISQIFLANRHFSWLDLNCSYAGIICFGFLAYLFVCRKQSKNTETLPDVAEKL